jgi:PAS domain S-box-containing protein
VIGRRSRDNASKSRDGALSAAEAAVPALVDVVALWPEAVILTDETNRILRANDAADALAGRPASPLTGRDVLDLVHVDDRSALRDQLKALRAGGAELHREFRIMTDAGVQRWVDAVGTNLLHIDGVGALMLQARDCTARKEAEFAAQRSAISAREADRRYRVAFETTLVGVATADIDGFYVDVNASLCELLGMARSELIGRHLTETVHREDRHEVEHTIGLLVTGALTGARQHEMRHLRADGATIVVEAAFVPIRDDGGAPLSLMVFSQDVTARHDAHIALQDALEREQQASQQLRELEATRGQLLAAVSHDFRTPLSAIAGFAELMWTGWDDYTDDERRDFAERITRNAGELDDRVSEFLDVARHDHSPPEAVLMVCRLDELVAQAIQRCRFVLDRHVVTCTADAVELLSEPLAVGRIVDNLLTNAAKYSAPGSPIDVEVREGGDGRAFVSVRDAGPGIPDDQLERIFEPFVRLYATAIDAPGAGVGLGGARALAQGLGGTLTAENNDGAGSTFTLTLPNASR